jgi:amino acid adenylation domain-containing protein/non-ribosomal peptide synthase protein (TIGR01720 family)
MGVTLSGRSVDFPGIEEMVGLFINTLPLRIKVDPQETPESYLKSLQEKTQHLNDYVCTPLSEIQSWVSSSQRLFDVLFVFENYPWQEQEKNDGELKVTNIQGIEKTEYPLTIIAVPGKALHLIFNYQTEHFDKELIKRLGLHIKKTLYEIVTNPQRSLDQITILTPQEEATLLTEWNDTRKDYPKDKTVHELFETQVNSTPDSVAIVYEEQSLTYQQLNERVNQLAHYLRNRGVKPDTLVAIAVERSLEMVIGILGILKAGGAYVPLDPSYPKDRLQFMLKDIQTPLLLTQGNLKCQFNSYNGSIIILDDDWETIAKEPSFNPSVNTSSRHLAYVIYTSGSTGKPKGVMIDHAGLINRLTWMKDRYRIKNKDRVLQKTPFVFDVSVWELFLPLLVGATEIIAPPHVHKDPTLLLQLIKDGYVSVCHFVPSMLIGFLEMSPVLGQTSLRMVVTSGEALPSKVVKDYYMKYRAPLHNLYGPTEASIDVTAFYCSSDLIPENIPIGTPIYNTHIYILDKYLNPVPVGIQGEIYIGGVGLARGYLNKPGLTAERFVPNPFGTGERLYRTGDLGRYIPDGNIEFLGRIDHQVKIRGYRIELGEIERTIENSGMVQQVVVLCREDVPGHKRLVAYVVPKKKEGGEFVRSLQKVCLDCLPEYMHPSQWVVLDAFPLTSNGKLDRKALPMPEGREGMGGYQAPEGLMEERLAQLWSQLLGIEKIGRLDNFFQIGGDSIISIQLVSRARQQGMFFTVRQVFETPTLAALALHTKETEKNNLVSQGLVQGRVSLTPIQKWFFDQNPANPHHYNQAMWIKSESPVDLDKLHTALKIVYHHHDGFRLRYKKSAEGWMQEYTEKDTPFTLEVLENVPKENLKDICTKLQSSLNLEEGPLSRVVWVAETQELLWVIHHLIVDGVSWRILLEDLNLAYAGKELGSKSHSYLSWSQSLHNYTPKNQEIEYYQAQMQYIPRLPSDYAYPGRASLQNTRTISTGLSEEITQQFLQRAHQSYGTRHDDLLLLALVYAIGDCFGKYQVCVDLEGHGREDLGESLDLTRTLGWFTGIHPVVLSLPEPTNIGQSIKHIKEYLRSVPKKGVSYGILSQIHKICTPVQGDLLFNYLGQWGNTPRNEEIFSFRAGDTGVNISENNSLSHSLIINSEINQGKLLFYWYYSTHHYRAETIENLSQSFKERLEALIEYCSEEKNYGYSPSDFPHIKLQGKQLDKLLEKLKG